MMKEDEGTDRMKEIAAHVRKGAMAYLRLGSKVVTIVFVVLAIIVSPSWLTLLKVQNPWVPFTYAPVVSLRTGRLLRYEDGYLCSARTANGARSGLDGIEFASAAVP